MGLEWIGIENSLILDNTFQAYILWFPTFIHTFLFSILSWWAMNFTFPKTSIFIWFTINIIAEISQSLNSDILKFLPHTLQNYCALGSFDWWDIGSIFLGSILALLLIRFLNKLK